MKTATWVAALLLMTGCVNVAFHVSKKEPSLTPSEPAVMADSSLAPAINAFGFDLYRSLAKAPGNLILSPLSVSTVLASLAPGAAGSTRAEILRVLHLGSANANYRALMTSLELRARADSAAWAMANRTWVQEGLELQPDFVNAARGQFDYEMGEADFAHAPDSARAAINQWIENQTRERVRDLLPRGSIDPSTRLVLVNAVYFKGLWKSPFKKDATTLEHFYPSSGASFTTPMMSQSGEFPLADLAHARMIEIPYRGEQLSMLVLLPDDRNGLGALERQLSADTLRAWVGLLRGKEVALKLPRFKTEWKSNLTETLASMGMPTAFRAGKADFSAIAKGEGLFLSAVFHGAFVEVNEEGTEAAAATGEVMQTLGARTPEMFTADHPFLFLIRDRETGCILFMGRVTDPRG
jgi:serine protease inhibitor